MAHGNPQPNAQGEPGELPVAYDDGLEFPRTRLSNMIEAVINGIGAAVNWLWAALVLIIVVNVTMRYALGVNYIWVEEVQWHIYAIGFMLGIGYAITHDSHVRVDVLAARFRRRTRAWIELLMIVVILGPMVFLIIYFAVPFVEAAYSRGEVSSAVGGLTHRWAIKAVIVVAFAYIGLAALARLVRITALLFGLPKPITGTIRN
ncbi:MAG: TRAP-type mannitol/chloroaromatic compound transport system, small permease component [Rhodobacteraceae bacterium HLUCCA12]|nr:MAG: TRAP-type mannitol/chloroaromatic compound transport system, small permease component [Rhodobacteraceae bacterium HLUCCA12]